MPTPRQESLSADHAIDWLEQLQSVFDQDIPISRAMGLRLVSLDHDTLKMSAPLGPNINDKGTAFGGSLGALLTLAAWGVVWIACKRSKLDCDIVIHKGEISYYQPVTSEINVICPIPIDSEWQTFKSRLSSKGKARMNLVPYIETDKGRAALFQCSYVALMRREINHE